MSVPKNEILKGESFPDHDRLIIAVQGYFRRIQILSGAVLAALTFYIIAYVPSMIERLGEAEEKTVAAARFDLATESILLSLLALLFAKIFLILPSAVRHIQEDDFTYTIGRLESKMYHRNATSLCVSGIHCADIARNYYGAIQGREYYVIYIKHLRLGLPCYE